MSLHGKVALVTGGARRLGRAIALAFAAAGADVIIHYNQSAEQGAAVVAELEALGVRAAAFAGDLAEVAAGERLVDAALEHSGRLDVLVNNAGIWGATPIGSVSPERWDALMHINLRSMFFIVQRAAPALRAAGGAIVNIADVGAIRPWRNYTPYLVSKGGVVTLTEALAKDLAPDVRVNAIAPGPVLKPDDWGDDRDGNVEQTTLLKRWGTAEDVGQAAVFLASAAYITGVILPVDGGNRLV
ncbi:MAG TPA: SDR family oxidoreductase [Roseiflexaceae bacterium]|nr:SDR family oxidoreductase [Roseiflexaceae bacterium]